MKKATFIGGFWDENLKVVTRLTASWWLVTWLVSSPFIVEG